MPGRPPYQVTVIALRKGGERVTLEYRYGDRR